MKRVSSFHCIECQEAHFSLTNDSWLKKEMKEIKKMIKTERLNIHDKEVQA